MSLDETGALKHDYEHLSLEALRKLFFRRVISYRGEYADIGIGTPDGKLGVPGAVFLSQAGWMTTEYGDDDGWFHCSQRDFERVTGLSDEAQKNVRKALIKRDIWEEELRGEDLDVRAAVTYRSGGKMFYRIKQNELRVALIGVIYNSPRYRPETDDDVAAARERRNKAAKEKRIKDREARRALEESQKRVSGNLGYISQSQNEVESLPIDAELCIRDSRIHVYEAAANTLPDLPQTPLIRQQQEIKKEQDNKQSASQNSNAIELPSSFETARSVVDFLNSSNVVVEDEQTDDFGENVSVLIKDLEMEGGMSRQTAAALIERHGAEICEAALDTPGAIAKLMATLPVAAPKSAPSSKHTPVLIPGPKSGMDAADLEAVTVAKLRKLGVKPNPLRLALSEHGAQYAATVLRGWESGELKADSAPALLTDLLKTGTYKPKATRHAAGGAAPAISEVWRDENSLDLSAVEREEASLDEEWFHLSDATCGLIEAETMLELGILGKPGAEMDAYRARAIRRELQRANREGKLREKIAAMKAAREARNGTSG